MNVWRYFFLVGFFCASARATVLTPDWTILIYIDANSNLEHAADFNLQQMLDVSMYNPAANIVVYVSRLSEEITHRYQLLSGQFLELAPLPSMGAHPAQEFTDAIITTFTLFPAQKYGVIAWNHGSGIEDLRRLVQQRGVFYNDRFNTTLRNVDLIEALTQTKAFLGKNLDLLAFDACLMGGLEVMYEIIDLVDIAVLSEEQIPDKGFNYGLSPQGWVAALLANPSQSPTQLATKMVSSYASFYTKVGERSWTLSAIDLSLVQAVVDQLLVIIDKFHAYEKALGTGYKIPGALLRDARSIAKQMHFQEYIDLKSLYQKLLAKLPPSSKNVRRRASQSALRSLKKALNDGIASINNAVITQVASPTYLPNVGGITITLPSDGQFWDVSPLPRYVDTPFAKQVPWVQFVKAYFPVSV